MKRFEHRPDIKTHPKSYQHWMQEVEKALPEAKQILIEKIEEMEEHLIETLGGGDFNRAGAQLADAVSCIIEDICEQLSSADSPLSQDRS